MAYCEINIHSAIVVQRLQYQSKIVESYYKFMYFTKFVYFSAVANDQVQNLINALINIYTRYKGKYAHFILKNLLPIKFTKFKIKKNFIRIRLLLFFYL